MMSSFNNTHQTENFLVIEPEIKFYNLKTFFFYIHQTEHELPTTGLLKKKLGNAH